MAKLKKGPSKAVVGPYAISRVLTIKEACELFSVSRSGVIYRIMSGDLIARKSDGELRGLWLLELESLVKIWGPIDQNTIIQYLQSRNKM